MEVDGEIDSVLLQQFSCMGTTDKDVLISEFQKFLGYKLNASGCAFFLDMNNWNLQAAICSYFDFDAPPKEFLPSMVLVKDVTIGDGEAVPPNTSFVKTWKIRNSGQKAWPPGCSLNYIAGDKMPGTIAVFLPNLAPNQTIDVSVDLESPSKPGIYQNNWRTCTATGSYFGELIWMIVTVAEGGLLAVTQQMEAFHPLGSQPQSIVSNPFALSKSPETSAHSPNQLVPTTPSSISQIQPVTIPFVKPEETPPSDGSEEMVL